MTRQLHLAREADVLAALKTANHPMMTGSIVRVLNTLHQPCCQWCPASWDGAIPATSAWRVSRVLRRLHRKGKIVRIGTRAPQVSYRIAAEQAAEAI
jgi:hypothetical protein